MNRVVAAIRGYGVIGAAVDVEGRVLGRVDVGAEPAVTEIVSGLRRRSLLIERTPVARQLRRLLPCEKARITVFVVPQPFAGLTAERIARLGLCRQRQDTPLLATAFSLAEDTPGKIILVPARLDEHHAATWSQPCQEICLVPVPGTVAHRLRICILPRAHRIVDYRQIGAETGNADTNAGGVVFTPTRERPAAGCLTIARQVETQRWTVLGHEVAHPTAPFFRQLGRVRGS